MDHLNRCPVVSTTPRYGWACLYIAHAAQLVCSWWSAKPIRKHRVLKWTSHYHPTSCSLKLRVEDRSFTESDVGTMYVVICSL